MGNEIKIFTKLRPIAIRWVRKSEMVSVVTRFSGLDNHPNAVSWFVTIVPFTPAYG